MSNHCGMVYAKGRLGSSIKLYVMRVDCDEEPPLATAAKLFIAARSSSEPLALVLLAACP